MIWEVNCNLFDFVGAIRPISNSLSLPRPANRNYEKKFYHLACWTTKGKFQRFIASNIKEKLERHRLTIKFIAKEMFEIFQALNKCGVVRNTDEPNQSWRIENKINCDYASRKRYPTKSIKEYSLIALRHRIGFHEWMSWMTPRRLLVCLMQRTI